MHIRLLLIIGGCGHFPTIHLRLGYNFVIDDAIKNTDATINLSERWPHVPRHPTVLLNVAG